MGCVTSGVRRTLYGSAERQERRTVVQPKRNTFPFLGSAKNRALLLSGSEVYDDTARVDIWMFSLRNRIMERRWALYSVTLYSTFLGLEYVQDPFTPIYTDGSSSKSEIRLCSESVPTCKTEETFICCCVGSD